MTILGRMLFFIFPINLALSCTSAAPSRELSGGELVGPVLEINWQDLVADGSDLFEPDPGIAFLRENMDPLVSRLQDSLKYNRALAELVVNRFMNDTIPYHGGALGRVGGASVFVAEKRIIPDYDKLHQVIMNVLSTRYGCLAKARRKVGDFQELFCRDGRKIEVTRKQGAQWIQFVANQFDRSGSLIVVHKHAIVRRVAVAK